MFRTSLKNIPSRIDFLIFFLYLSFVFIASVLLGFGESGLLFLSGKHSPTVVHTTHYRLWTFFLSSTTTPHGWIRGGYLDAFTTGRDSIQAACFIWPFSFRYLWLSRKRRTRSNARRSAQVRDRNFSMESSLISLELSFPFFSLSFHLFGLERRLGRYPQSRTTDTRV